MLTRRNFLKSLGAFVVLPIVSQVVQYLPAPSAVRWFHHRDEFTPADIPGLIYWYDARRDGSNFHGIPVYNIAVYDRPLTEAENRQVSDYINSHWHV